ncbi:MAG: MobA/MobL family protein [Proteobacteria bacterium]|nr:MobA/MobL family protein [Pseudomonadota bacterium]
MAIYRLQISSIARGDGHSSVGAAAYRAGEKLRDDRTNEIHNHSRRKDVQHSEIMLPSELAGQKMEWARDRASLWNSVEHAEGRKNARVAREIQVNLPHELPSERRIELARAFSQEVADHYKVAVDLAVHEPRPAGDPRNHHAHLLMTTREVSPEGLGAKAGLELSTHDRARLGLPSGSVEFTAIRERWAAITNEALKEANIEARVDHRSLAEQGIDREPKPHIPFAAYKIERAGKYSDVAESIRADYNARVQARMDRQAEREPIAPAAQPAPALQPAQPALVQQASQAQQPAQDPAPKSLEDIRREARENWLKLRAQQPAASTDPPSPTADRGRAAQRSSDVRDNTDSTPTSTRTPDNDHQP